MNYYLPYQSPYFEPQKIGLFNKIFKNGINWSSFLSNTQKTLNIVNQTIPVIKQMGPVINNTKTMFKLMNEFKKIDTPQKKETTFKTETKKETKEIKQINETNKTINNKQINYNNPTFFQ